jgi:polysaccharide biosynthesis/export protein
LREKSGLNWIITIVLIFSVSSCAIPQKNTSIPPVNIQQGTEEYILGPEDILEVSVWKDENLIKQVVVRPDGNISFPLIGDIQASGLTASQLQKRITEKIKVYIPDAIVTVMVLKVNSLKVYVLGKVAKPGEYIIGKKINVMQALSMAGGLLPFADSDAIVILRDDAGGKQKIKFDYNQVAKGKNPEQNVNLKRGDVIVVP